MIIHEPVGKKSTFTEMLELHNQRPFQLGWRVTFYIHQQPDEPWFVIYLDISYKCFQKTFSGRYHILRKAKSIIEDEARLKVEMLMRANRWIQFMESKLTIKTK